MTVRPYAEYSEGADAVYVTLSESAVARTRTLDDRRMVDLAADGSIAGIEFLDVSAGIDLRELPERQVVEPLIRQFHFPVFV